MIKILFEAYHLYHLPQFLPFYRRIKDDPRFDIWFTTSAAVGLRERTVAVEALKAEGVRTIMADTEEARLAALDAAGFDFVFVGWGRKGYVCHLQDKPGPAVIMIYHGIGVKASYFRDNNPRVDYRVVESPYRLDLLRKHGVPGEPLLAGFVKLDPLFRAENFDRAGLLRSLGLDPARKTVLYAPTFYPSSIGIVKDAIATRTEGHNVIIKLHDYTHHKRRFEKDRLLMTGLPERYPHVKVMNPDAYNILPLMAASDLMITDASSVMFEYLALNRPLIVFTRYALYWRHRIFSHWFRKTRIDTDTIRHQNFFDRITSPATLRRQIDAGLAQPDLLAHQRQRTAADLLHYTDGKSSERLLEHFNRLIAARSTAEGSTR